MIKVWSLDNPTECIQGGLEVIPQNSSEQTVWVEIQSDDDLFIKSALKQMGCHSLAITDALRLRHPPKVEYFEDQIFILYKGVKEVHGDLVFDHQQVSFFISDNRLITLSRSATKGIEAIKLEKSFPKLLACPIRLACKIMHFSAGIYLDEVLQFDATLGELEDELLNAGTDKTLIELTSYKSRILKLIRMFNYHQRITQQLIKEGEGIPLVVDEESYHVINDLHERFERLFSLSNMHYDICGDLIDGYLSITSHQLNNTMRILTVVTAIFVPLSFLAGLYGMNFDVMPELHYEYGYYALLATMALTSVVLIYTFKKKKWF